MKYIMFKKKVGETVLLMPVIFPTHVVHADVAKMLTCDIGPLAGYAADSAGEVSLFDIEGECHGESTTIGVKSKPKRDTHVIKMHDYGVITE